MFMSDKTTEQLHREGTARLATALEEVVQRRGKKDLREWGGPSAGTIRDILAGTWQRSPQSRKTFEKLDAGADWPTGVARLLYFAHPSVFNLIDEDGHVRRPPMEGMSDVPIPTIRTDEKPLPGVTAVVPDGQGVLRHGATTDGELTVSERELIGQAVGLLAEAVEILRAVAEPPPGDRQ